MPIGKPNIASLRNSRRCAPVFSITPERTNQTPSRNMPIKTVAKTKSFAALLGKRCPPSQTDSP